MSPPIIAVENLSKSYLVGHESEAREHYTTLRDVLGRHVKSFARKTWDMLRGRQIIQGDEVEEFWALKNVSFEVQEGEVVGIIGNNGAGKSTLLKILSRITEPTTGRVTLRGRVASLLEVGTGFHPELTGRENVFLNGAILGMTRGEIRRKFDEIVAFAGVERFLDTPVKRYSSGMYVRLAFAVAAHLEPEILVVDEVLAVGDAEFQKKCLGKMKDVTREGRTVLFVSHNMSAIQTLCTSAVLLQGGTLLTYGSVDTTVQQYLLSSVTEKGTSWVRESKVDSLPNPSIQSISVSLIGKQPSITLKIFVEIGSSNSHPPVFLAVDIHTPRGDWIMQAIPKLEPFISGNSAHQKFIIEIDLPPLIPGAYALSLWLGSSFSTTIDWAREVVQFEIVESPSFGRTHPHSIERGYIVPVSRLVSAEDWSVSAKESGGVLPKI